MQSQSTGRFQKFLLSMMMSASIFCFVGIVSLVTLPTPAFAQEEKKEGEELKAEEGAKQEKGKVNPVVHFFASIGWVFGMMFAAISIGMVALIIILVLDLRLGEAVPPAFVEEFTEMVNKRQFKQAYDLCKSETSYIGRVLTAGMGRLQYGIEDARESMHAMSESVRTSKDSWNSYLGVIGTLGPLLGLVGTVSGMIGAFRKLGESTKAPEASELAGEISHALVVTLVGVGVAVPAIFFFTVFKNRLTGLAVNTMNLADDLLTQMYHNSKKTTGGPAPSVERGSTGVQVKS